MFIQDDQSILAIAETRPWGGSYSVKFWDSGWGDLWRYSDTLGIRAVVRATSFEEAWECVVDEILVPIDAEDLPDAFPDYAGCDASLDCKGGLTSDGTCNLHPDACRNLGECHYYQGNATGTGIVATDLNGEDLRPVTERDFDEGLRVTLITDY